VMQESFLGNIQPLAGLILKIIDWALKPSCIWNAGCITPKKPTHKTPYSASFAFLEYSECLKPWSALLGLILSVCLLGT
jgi:hypothetical protein